MAEDEKEIDLSKVSVTRDSINLGDDHGVQRGDKIVYDNGGGESIGGLVSGQTYYAVLDDYKEF